MVMTYGTARFKWQYQTQGDWVDITDYEEYDDNGNINGTHNKQVTITIGGDQYSFDILYRPAGAYTGYDHPRVTVSINKYDDPLNPSSLCLIPRPQINTENNDFLFRAVCSYYQTIEDEENNNAVEVQSPPIFLTVCGFHVLEPQVEILEENADIITSIDCVRTFTANFISQDNETDFFDDIYEYGIFIARTNGSITYFNNTTPWITTLEKTGSNNDVTITAVFNFCYIINDYDSNGVTENFWQEASFGLYAFASKNNVPTIDRQIIRSNAIKMNLGFEPITLTQDLSGPPPPSINVGEPMIFSFNYSPKNNSNFILEYGELEGTDSDGDPIISNWLSVPGVTVVQNTVSSIVLSVDNFTGLWSGRLYRVRISNPSYTVISNMVQVFVIDNRLYVVPVEQDIYLGRSYADFSLLRFDQQ